MNDVDLLTVREVAALLRLSGAAVYALCRSGRLAHHRLGEGKSAIRISRADVVAYLEQSKEGAAHAGVSDPGTPAVAPAGRAAMGGGFKHLRVDGLLGGRPRADAPSSDPGGRSAQ